MNRTATYLILAGGLGLLALVIGVRATAPAPTPPPAPAGVAPVVVAPKPAEPAPFISSDGSIHMEARLSHPYVAPGSNDVFVTVDLTAVQLPGSERAPVNMALVIDRSGSMNGVKLADAKRAAEALVSQLSEKDRLAIVHFGSDVRFLQSMPASDENKARMRRYIESIWDDGGTNIGGGLNAGFAQVSKSLSDFKVNRILFISDGQPTEGITSPRALARIASNLHQQGVSVSALGVGLDFNEDLMTSIAEEGAGSYGYFKNTGALASIFQKDLQQASTQVARNVSVRFELPQGVHLEEVLGRSYLQDNVGNVTVAMPDFAAGQNEKLVLKVSVQGAAVGNPVDVTDIKLAYLDLLKQANAQVETRAHLASLTTDKREDALARRDKNAVVIATNAQAAVNYKKAATLVEQGRFHDAEKAVRANDTFFEDAEVLGAGPQVAPMKQQNEALYGLVAAQPSAPAPARIDAVKQLKVESQRSAGKGASLY